MKAAIVKYNAGNVQSVQFALERLGVECHITDNHDELKSADRVIFPGVGHAESAMNHLKSLSLDRVIAELKQPVLGICLGMQLMCKFSEEGNTDCLGIFNADVVKLKNGNDPQLKIPHTGWNQIHGLKSDLFKGLNENDFVYFIHGYAVMPNYETIALSKHGVEFSAAMRRDNFYAVQFHPEKSGRTGSKILENFISITN